VHLVFTQDGTQMALPEDQHAVEELTAQGVGERPGRRPPRQVAEPAQALQPVAGSADPVERAAIAPPMRLY
jgi:hypothetical protein